MRNPRSRSLGPNSDLRVNYTASGRGFVHPIVVDAGHPLLSFAIARRAAAEQTPVSIAQPEVRESFREADASGPDAAVSPSGGASHPVTDVSTTLATTAAPAVSVHVAINRTWRRDDGSTVAVRVWHLLAELSQN